MRCIFATGLLLLTACAGPVSKSAAPLDVLPAETALADVRADLIATANARFGEAGVADALRAPAYLIAKRFAGMLPPPPPGNAGAWPPPPPTALMKRQSGEWFKAEGTGWRRIGTARSAQIDALLTDPRLWSEPAVVGACPDFGAANLLLKASGKAETVRNAMCTSAAAELVGAALDA
jgi:hypothetical protein